MSGEYACGECGHGESMPCHQDEDHPAYHEFVYFTPGMSVTQFLTFCLVVFLGGSAVTALAEFLVRSAQ